MKTTPCTAALSRNNLTDQSNTKSNTEIEPYSNLLAFHVRVDL